MEGLARTWKNLVIAHERAFYNHEDGIAALLKDPVYLANQKFMDENEMAPLVMRLVDDPVAFVPAGELFWAPRL